MTKDKIIDELGDRFDPAAIAHYLDMIASDLEISKRDDDETLPQYAERLISAVQDNRFALNDELDQLERDLLNVIEHLGGEQAFS